jgi:hypothetical protein
MAEQPHPSHGSTPAAWTAMAIALIGFVGASVAVMAGQMTIFYIGLALLPVSLIVGYVMSKMGYGESH